MLFKRKKPAHGDEYIKLLPCAGDAYHMDGVMQCNYVHSLPRRSCVSSRRTVLIFRDGEKKKVCTDSGKLIRGKDPLKPSQPRDTTCMGILPFLNVLVEGKCYDRKYLYDTGCHASDRCGVNGNMKDGCDSIVVSKCDPNTKDRDQLAIFYYTCKRVQRNGAMHTSFVQKIVIRVFRSSRLVSAFAPLPDKKDNTTLYRYDGLYAIRNMFDTNKRCLQVMPLDGDVSVVFELVRLGVDKKEGNLLNCKDLVK